MRDDQLEGDRQQGVSRMYAPKIPGKKNAEKLFAFPQKVSTVANLLCDK